MRIISGKYRGKKLFTPKDNNTRPTSDRAKESIFNIISNEIENDWENISFLDVFSGTGNVALEALSRGAKEVCLIDKDTSIILKNSQLFPSEKGKIRLLKLDALKLLHSSQQYDIIFLDPPYNKGMAEICLEELKKKNWIKKGSICIVELEKRENLQLVEGFEEFDNRVYGISKFVFLTYV